MDLESMQIPLIFAAVFVLGSVILILVYKFGIKEKSYEEALAEQRQNTHNLLPVKQKPKDKKTKKNNKKVKEKDHEDKKLNVGKTEVVSKSDTEMDVAEKPKQEAKQSKIKFNKFTQKTNEDIDEIDGSSQLSKEKLNEKAAVVKKSEPSKPLKEKTSNVKKDDASKEKITKDNKKDDLIKEKTLNLKKDEAVKEKNLNIKKDEPVKEKAVIIKEKVNLKKDEQTKRENKEKQVTLKDEALTVYNVPEKEEQQTEEVEVVIEKVDLIKDDNLNGELKQSKPSLDKIQAKQVGILTQNKERKEVEEKVTSISKAPLVNGFIINPTKDKKKKKNELNALQQLTAAPGGPGMAFILNMVHKAELSHSDIQVLIELLLNKQLDAPSILDDWSEGKSDPVQKLKKQLAEKEKALADEQETLAGVQMKLKEIRNEQLAERNASNQKIKILEEQLQNHQMEIHSCNNRYHAQGQQLQQIQMQLNEERMKLHALTEELGAVQMQRQQLEMQIVQEVTNGDQLLIEFNHIQETAKKNEASYVAQLNNLTQELGEKSRQLEELRMELANKNDILYRQEGDLKTEIAQINAVMQQQAEEIRKTEQGKEELMEEINNLKKQKNISTKIITQLKSEIEKMQQEMLQKEASMENNKINETDILNLRNELASIKNQLEENEKKFNSDLETKSSLFSKLEKELEEQRTKNNELRNKNYKIMEALNAAETRIKNCQIENSNKENGSLTEIDTQKKFLSRLLPEVNGIEDISPEEWEEKCSQLVTSYLDSLKKSAVSDSTENLQARIEYYQNVIKNTEGMLSKLQEHIDQEQISWKAQMKSKDLELVALKEKLEKSQNLETINGSSLEEQ